MIKHTIGWLDKIKAAKLLEICLSWPLAESAVVVWDKVHKLPRLTCWFSDTGEPYRYSGQATPVSRWPDELLEVRNKIHSDRSLNLSVKMQSCLINYYRTGSDSVGWHSDDESIFGTNPTIISISCGATRKFKMRNRNSGKKMDFELSNGDLLLLSSEHVTEWQHCITKTSRPVGPRLNLTFRSGRWGI